MEYIEVRWPIKIDFRSFIVYFALANISSVNIEAINNSGSVPFLARKAIKNFFLHFEINFPENYS